MCIIAYSTVAPLDHVTSSNTAEEGARIVPELGWFENVDRNYMV